MLHTDDLATALDLAPAMIRRPDGHILHWTSGMIPIYGYGPAEAVGRISHTLLQTQFSEPLPIIQEKLFRDGRWNGEFIHRHKDGHFIHVASLWTLQPHGDKPTVIEVCSDISARVAAVEALKAAQTQLAEINAELEERVEDRTRRLEDANGQLEAFAYSTAHDFGAAL